MSLFCGTDGDHDGADWWWYKPSDDAPLTTKRSKRFPPWRIVGRINEIQKGGKRLWIDFRSGLK